MAEEDEESEFDLTVSEIQLKKGSGESSLGTAPAPLICGLLRSFCVAERESPLGLAAILAVMRVWKVGEVFVLTLSLSGCLM